MKKHLHLVVNTQAGSGNGKRTAKKIVKQLKLANLDYTTYYTDYAGHEMELVRSLASTLLIPWEESLTLDIFPLLVILGGDGTLHNALNALMPFDPAIPIGYIPCGSGNDFARGVGIHPQGLKAFVQLSTATKPRNIHVIHYEECIQQREGLAANNIGIGIDGKIVNVTNTSTVKKKLNTIRLGFLSYAFSVFSVLMTKKSFPIIVELNGKEIQFGNALLCTLTNHPYFGGGIPIAPTAEPTKETMDLVVVEKIHLLKIFWLMVLVLRKKQLSSNYFHHFQSKKIRIISTIPQYIQADGEILGKQNADISFWTECRNFWF